MRPPNTKAKIKAYLKANGAADAKEISEAINSGVDWVRQAMREMLAEGTLEVAWVPDQGVSYGRKYRLKQQSVPFTSFLQFAKGPGLRDSVVAHTSPFPPGVPLALTEVGCSPWAIKKHWEQYYALQE